MAFESAAVRNRKYHGRIIMANKMILENRLNITDSDELAREEERISKKKAVQLFDNKLLDSIPAGKIRHITGNPQVYV